MSKKDAIRMVDRLAHIVAEANFIRRSLGDMDAQVLDSNEEKRRAIERSLGIIGEAGNRLLTRHDGFAKAYPEMAHLLDIARNSRHELVHEYFVAMPNIWVTATEHVPVLRRMAMEILREMDPEYARSLESKEHRKDNPSPSDKGPER